MGPTGPAGPQGLQGVTGSTGAQGPTTVGPTGATGRAGPAGAQGATGYIGAQGSAEMVGYAGPAGVAGAAGPQGPVGATGSQGPMIGNDGWKWYGDYNFNAYSNTIQGYDRNKAGDLANYLNQSSSRRIGLDGSDPQRVTVVRDALIAAGVPAYKIQSGPFGNPQLRNDGRVAVLIQG